MTSGPVVVGVDGSEQSERALLWAANYVQTVGAELLVVLARVHPVPVTNVGPQPVWPWPITHSRDEHGVEQTKHFLSQAVDAVLADEFDADLRVLVEDGEAAQVLIDVAQREKAQLAVTGRRGIGGFRRLLLGSVSDEVARYSPCPVAVISKPDTNRDFAEVVAVGVDGSQPAEQAVQWAADYAMKAGHRLLILHAWDRPRTPPDSLAALFPTIDDNSDVLARVAQAVVDEAISKVRSTHAGLDVQGRVLTGYPSSVLEEAGDKDNVALLVVGTRGLGGFSSMMLGSVADQLLHHGRRPIVVVRPAVPE